MSKRKPYSFRPDTELAERLQRSLAATNSRPGDLIAACVEASLDSVTRQRIEARRAAETALLRETPTPYRINPKPKK